MKKLLITLHFFIVCLGMSTHLLAETKRIQATGMETIVGYKITQYTPQIVTFTGLTAKEAYSLSCYPDTSMLDVDEVTVEVLSHTNNAKQVFGGKNYKSALFTKLKPFKYDNTYNIQYTVSTATKKIQQGVCSFK